MEEGLEKEGERERTKKWKKRKKRRKQRRRKRRGLGKRRGGGGANEGFFQSCAVMTFHNLSFIVCHPELNLASQFRDIQLNTKQNTTKIFY